MKGAEDTPDVSAKEKLKETRDCKIGNDQSTIQKIWLPEKVLPGFRQQSIQLYWRLILDAFIMSLALNEEQSDFIRRIHSGQDNQLRLLHYPPRTDDQSHDAQQSRLGLHQDWSSFTLLFQDSHGGLEFANRETSGFMPAAPIENTLYMNIGDMFIRLSNGKTFLHRIGEFHLDSLERRKKNG
ncbi:MAG: hypothetical protein Q9219_007303 [cf. Caloplaca sp. 3 TL-2023]